MTSSCSPAFMISTALAQPSAAWARSLLRSSESHVNPSPNAYQSTPSWRPTFSSPVFQLPDLMNCTTATFHPRPTARTIMPNADDDLPLPLPVFTTTSDSARRNPSGRGSSVGASSTASRSSSALMRLGSVRPDRYDVELSVDAANFGENPRLSRNGGFPAVRRSGTSPVACSADAALLPRGKGRLAGETRLARTQLVLQTPLEEPMRTEAVATDLDAAGGR